MLKITLKTPKIVAVVVSVVAVCCLASAAEANITVKLADPTWTFAIDNLPSQATEGRLRSNESAFAQTIKPWLAAGEYDKVIAAFDKRPLAEDSPALQILRGQVLLNARQLESARLALSAAVKSAPNLANGHRSLSMVYMLQKAYPKAREHLIASINLGNADAQVYGQLAFINLQNHSPSSAVSGYQQALLLEPENSQWQQGLLYALTQAKALDQALALVEEILAQQPNNAEYWLLRSQIALQQQRPSEALSSLEVALRLGNQDPSNQALAAQLHLKHGSIERAVSLQIQSLKQATKDTDDSTTYKGYDNVAQLGSWLAYQQQWQQLTRLLKALEQNKASLANAQQARIDVLKAELASHQGQTQQARQWLQKAIDKDPLQGDALIRLAGLFMAAHQNEQAELYYLRAKSLDDYREASLLGLAQLNINAQDYPQAIKNLREVVRINPARTDLQANLHSLEKLARAGRND